MYIQFKDDDGDTLGLKVTFMDEVFAQVSIRRHDKEWSGVNLTRKQAKQLLKALKAALG